MKGIPYFVVVLFLGCASLPPAKRSGEIPPASPVVASAAVNKPIPEYRFGFGDVIEVKFFRHEEFDEEVAVRPDGRISLARIGDLEVINLTPTELDSIVTQIYGEFVREPDVTVIVREFGGYKVYVLGEVNTPGGFPIERNLTVVQALALAGGHKRSAKIGSVILLRREADDMTAVKIDLNGAHLAEHNMVLQPQDIIYVPKTVIANVSDFMQLVYQGFLPPLDLYLRAVLFYDRL